VVKFFLRTTALPLAVRKLAQAAVGIISQSLSDEEVLYTFDLALFEACANVVQHAYAEGDAGDVLIILSIEEGDFVEVEIIDWGKGFPAYPVSICNAHP
jgi:serine/threonine-protein kinase RsbW